MMDGDQKLIAWIAVCFMVTISVVAFSTAYYYSTIEAAAIKAGLEQERIGNQTIWVKPKTLGGPVESTP